MDQQFTLAWIRAPENKFINSWTTRKKKAVCNHDAIIENAVHLIVLKTAKK